MAFEEENNTLFIDTTLRSMASIIGAILTRNNQRRTYKKIGDKLFKFVAEELVRRKVPYRVAAEMLGVSLRTFHRKMKGKPMIKSGSQASSILSYIVEKRQVNKTDLYRHFHYLSPDFLGSSLRDLNLMGHIRIEGNTLCSNDNLWLHQQTLSQTYIHFVLLHYDEIEIEELIKVVPLSILELREALAGLIQNERILLEKGKYRALLPLEITDSSSSSKEEFLIFSLISMIEAQCRSIAIRLDSEDSTVLSKGALRAFRVDRNEEEFQNIVDGLTKIRQSLEDLWVRSPGFESGDTFITAFIGHAIWGNER